MGFLHCPLLYKFEAHLQFAMFQVLLARWRSRLVAVKLLRDDFVNITSSLSLEKEFRQEAKMLQDMHSPFILEFLAAYVDSKPVRCK